SDDAITVEKEEHHLGVPVISRQRPAVAEHDRLTAAPVLVEDIRAVGGGDHAHVLVPSFQDSDGAEKPVAGCSGVPATGSALEAWAPWRAIVKRCTDPRSWAILQAADERGRSWQRGDLLWTLKVDPSLGPRNSSGPT